MDSKSSPAQGNRLERFSQAVSQWTGSSRAFGLALGLVIVWAIVGPLFGFSQSWQMVINTGTTIATFLMVFLIQRAQNKESRAIQLKLNEIVAAIEGASNRLVGAEELSEEELHRLHDRYVKLAEEVQTRHGSLNRAASVEETTGTRPATEAAMRASR
ncbi:MAG TPA: low affinity iron permease family protein [Thermoanaerobaculia bacterium]|nr:low affinity iron permease family protein [Thermoanaerobaculia bacterium]